jgi:hypothetical protein
MAAALGRHIGSVMLTSCCWIVGDYAAPPSAAKCAAAVGPARPGWRRRMEARERSGLKLPWVAPLIVAAAYAEARLTFNVELHRASWQQLYDLTAPLPFGHRILVPLLSRPLVGGLGLEVSTAFLLLEAVAAAALFVCLRGALATRIDQRFASLAAIVAFLWLAYPFLLQHRLPFYMPYDTASMAFTAAFLWAVLRQRLALAVAICLVATLNRETTLFYPLLAGLLLLRRLPLAQLASLCAVLLAAHGVARAGIALALPDNPGHALEFFAEGVPRVTHNMAWLTDPRFPLLLLASLGFQPLFWLMLARWVPADVARLRLAAWAIFLALTLVGNIFEPRMFGELLVVMALPVAVAAVGWVTGAAAPSADGTHSPALSTAVTRWGLAAIILPWAAATLTLRFLVAWPAAAG